MKHSLRIFAVILALTSHAYAQNDTGCMNSFYQSQDPKCIEAVAQVVNNMPSGSKINQGLVGFLAEIFKSSPQQKKIILAGNATDSAKRLCLEALVRAGLTDDAANYASANNLASVTRENPEKAIPLHSLMPSANPADNDLLIGAYMASGNTIYIQQILDSFKSAEDSRINDAVRAAYAHSQFGGGMAPEGRPNTMAKTLCKKYECESNLPNYMRTMTLSSALWAMHSLSANDSGIQKTLAAAILANPRLKIAMDNEDSAISVYMTMLTVSAANEATAKNVEPVLALYETFEPAKKIWDTSQKILPTIPGAKPIRIE